MATFQEIKTAIRKKDFKPVYLLHGDEPYYIDAIADEIEEHALTESEKAFNQTVIYGKDADPVTVSDAARRYPMMAQRQLIILREAQEMKNLAKLEKYLLNPVSTTVLVICHKHKRLDKRTKFYKNAKANALIFESKKLYDNKVPAWIEGYLSDKKFSIEPSASSLIAEYLGTELANISNELDKLAINLPEGTRITTQHVQDNIGISKDYNVFELQKALGTNDVTKANRIVNYFIANPKKNPLVMVIASLYGYFAKVLTATTLRNLSDNELAKAMGMRSAWFVKDYRAATRHYNRLRTEKVIHILHQFDLRSKGVHKDSAGNLEANEQTPDGELLREMVMRVLLSK